MTERPGEVQAVEPERTRGSEESDELPVVDWEQLAQDPDVLACLDEWEAAAVRDDPDYLRELVVVDDVCFLHINTSSWWPGSAGYIRVIDCFGQTVVSSLGGEEYGPFDDGWEEAVRELLGSISAVEEVAEGDLHTVESVLGPLAQPGDEILVQGTRYRFVKEGHKMVLVDLDNPETFIPDLREDEARAEWRLVQRWADVATHPLVVSALSADERARVASAPRTLAGILARNGERWIVAVLSREAPTSGWRSPTPLRSSAGRYDRLEVIRRSGLVFVRALRNERSRWWGPYGEQEGGDQPLWASVMRLLVGNLRHVDHFEGPSPSGDEVDELDEARLRHEFSALLSDVFGPMACRDLSVRIGEGPLDEWCFEEGDDGKLVLRRF